MKCFVCEKEIQESHHDLVDICLPCLVYDKQDDESSSDFPVDSEDIIEYGWNENETQTS